MIEPIIFLLQYSKIFLKKLMIKGYEELRGIGILPCWLMTLMKLKKLLLLLIVMNLRTDI